MACTPTDEVLTATDVERGLFPAEFQRLYDRNTMFHPAIQPFGDKILSEEVDLCI
jgi:hypothetical protein